MKYVNSIYFALEEGGWKVKEDIEEIVEEYNLTESEAEELLREAERIERIED